MEIGSPVIFYIIFGLGYMIGFCSEKSWWVCLLVTIFWPFFLAFNIGLWCKQIPMFPLEEIKPNSACPHGYEDWSDCPDCGH
jgi:hypothetical protein